MEYHDYETLEPLSEIAQMAWCDASLKQLQEWASKRERNAFPEPRETLGRFTFYDPAEVKKWLTLWRKATKNTGRGEAINGKRSGK